VNLEENVRQLRESLTVTSALSLRHEERLKEHQQWLEDNELAYARHRVMMTELDEKMTQLASAQLVTEERLKGLIETIERSTNGHS